MQQLPPSSARKGENTFLTKKRLKVGINLPKHQKIYTANGLKGCTLFQVWGPLDMWCVTRDGWHLTQDMWHMTSDGWHKTFFPFIFGLLLSVHVEKVSVSCMQDFFTTDIRRGENKGIHCGSTDYHCFFDRVASFRNSL